MAWDVAWVCGRGAVWAAAVAVALAATACQERTPSSSNDGVDTTATDETTTGTSSPGYDPTLTCGNGIIDPGELCFHPPVLATAGRPPQPPEIADVDGDGIDDLLVLGPHQRSAAFSFEGNDLVSMGGAPLPFEAWDPLGFVVGDIDGDGRADLAGTRNDDDPGTTLTGLAVLLGAGDGSFELAVEVPAERWVIGGADFDVDGRTDVAMASHIDFVIWRSVGDLEFSPGTPITWNESNPDGLYGHDLTGDGRPEGIVLDHWLCVGPCADQWHVGVAPTGELGPAAAPVFAVRGPGRPRPAVGDVDGDGELDVIVANPGFDETATLQWFSVLPNAAPEEDVEVRDIHPTAAPLAAADLDMDGVLDLALSLEETEEVTILVGPIHPSETTPYKLGIRGQASAARDFSGDGVPDLIIESIHGTFYLASNP